MRKINSGAPELKFVFEFKQNQDPGRQYVLSLGRTGSLLSGEAHGLLFGQTAEVEDSVKHACEGGNDG